MNNKIKILDDLLTVIAKNQRSVISGATPAEPHHIIGRANQLLRWDLNNILWVTRAEHILLHSGVLKIENYVTQKRMGYLRDKKIESLTWKPTIEFYEQTEKKLRSTIK